MNTLRRISFLLTACLLAVVMAISGQIRLSAFVFPTAHATEGESGSVLTDLQRAYNFDPSIYPADSEDYSLQVIQVAEGENNELFIYVYQPSHYTKDLIATSITMHYGYSAYGSGLDPQLYDLELIDSDGVFDKYKVKNFSVPSDTNRFYNIISIFRRFDEVDGENSNNTSEKGFSIGQQWRAFNVNNNVVYEMNTFAVEEIEINLVSTIILEEGFSWDDLIPFTAQEHCSVHFVAFTPTNKNIDHIVQARLGYKERPVSSSYMELNGVYYFADENSSLFQPGAWSSEKYVTLNEGDSSSFNNSSIWNEQTFEWNRILTKDEFINTFNSQDVVFSADLFSDIEESTHVFCFKESSFKSSYYSSHGFYKVDYTEVGEVTILRLNYFDYSGNFYDVGVVSDKVNSSGIAGIAGSSLFNIDDIWVFLKIILGGLALILIIQIIGPFISPIISAVLSLIWKGIKIVFSATLSVLLFPLRLVGRLLGFKDD